MTYFSEKEISKQETLTVERFKQLSATTKFVDFSNRPTHSLVELMKWATIQVASFSKQMAKIGMFETFIHNTINMDGSFMVFAEDVGAKVKAIHTDALTSWQTDFDDEHFIACGIFEIVKDDLKFYHCGLFHKGNQNEDEVSFFNIVVKDQVEKYINFRNEFSEWQNKRDRETREIEVIGGEPEPIKDLDLTWDDLILPQEIKSQIVTSIEGFLKSKELFKKLNCPWKTGMGFWGTPGCGKTLALRIIMAQYKELKPVKIAAGIPDPNGLLEAAFDYAEEHSPALLYFEDFQEFVKLIGSTNNFLQLMDGVKPRNGILTIVTGNDSESLHSNLKNRPGRFDKFFNFPSPDQDLAEKYLKKYFGDILSDVELKELASDSVTRKFSYAYLREIYINSVYIAIAAGREAPNKDDVKASMAQVSGSKKSSESNFSSKKRKMQDRD